MSSSPQFQPPRRFPRARLEGQNPAVLRFQNGHTTAANLQVISVNGGLLSLSRPVIRGAHVKLIFLTGSGAVLGGAEMLSPVTDGLQPFRFISLTADDHRRLGALVSQQSSQNRSEQARVETRRAVAPDTLTPKFGIRPNINIALAVPIAVIAVVLGWCQWQQGWTALEAQIPAKDNAVVQPQLNVPPDAMERRLLHQVMPEYPELARQSGEQGTVVLDTVVNVAGMVTQVKSVSGPAALSQAAMNAVRWWRYEPYSVNGRPATVETTVAVDFRLPN